MKRVKAKATGVVWTFPDDLADSLLKRADEFEGAPEAPAKTPAKKTAAKPSEK